MKPEVIMVSQTSPLPTKMVGHTGTQTGEQTMQNGSAAERFSDLGTCVQCRSSDGCTNTVKDCSTANHKEELRSRPKGPFVFLKGECSRDGDCQKDTGAQREGPDFSRDNAKRPATAFVGPAINAHLVSGCKAKVASSGSDPEDKENQAQ
ncbi:hypothetical protein PoB_003872400, partial [Plakobranchus ocellatus]